MGTDPISGAQEGPSNGITGCPPPNPERRDKRGGGAESYEGEKGDKPITFRMTFPEKAVPRPCPVEGCSGQSATRTSIQIHSCHWHVRDSMVILEEGNILHPQCPLWKWWWHGGIWMGGIGALWNSRREMRERDGARNRRRRGRSYTGPSARMDAPWRLWHLSNTWGGWYQRRTMIGWG